MVSNIRCLHLSIEYGTEEFVKKIIWYQAIKNVASVFCVHIGWRKNTRMVYKAQVYLFLYGLLYLLLLAHWKMNNNLREREEYKRETYTFFFSLAHQQQSFFFFQQPNISEPLIMDIHTYIQPDTTNSQYWFYLWDWIQLLKVGEKVTMYLYCKY